MRSEGRINRCRSVDLMVNAGVPDRIGQYRSAYSVRSASLFLDDLEKNSKSLHFLFAISGGLGYTGSRSNILNLFNVTSGFWLVVALLQVRSYC